MSDILLAKPKLPEGFIDLSVGEPHVVRETLRRVFNLSEISRYCDEHVASLPSMYEYPNPSGYERLIKLLEDKYKAPVVITNGAKQALGACFYALNQLGMTKVGMRTPYWALIPPLVKMHGLEPMTSYVGTNANLLIVPNNPDGFTSEPVLLQGFVDNCRSRGVPVIHDAAYYTPVYMPQDSILNALGDVQIFSVSKMLGLSGLRIGFAVCYDQELYKLIQQYMEAMTVGVSMLSQVFLYELLYKMYSNQKLSENFEASSWLALNKSKLAFKQVHPDVLEVPDNFEDTAGMFGWFKVGPKADFTKSKLNVIDGALFGVPGYVRINMAFDLDKVKEIVTRLNSVV
ncbi:MAG TPA: pyridoxal phosphate-dependent aminotransferase [Anaerovoracaceae bacterium]|nr:pyridoxal phosphate-dependent aminotransferase [Anaerovoracaceae bacterium]